MNVKDLKSDGLKREFEIQIPATEIQSSLDTKLQEIGSTAKIPGFRPGKIPPAILKKRYGDSVQADVLQQVVQDNVVQMMKDKDLRAAMQPDVKLSDYEVGKDLTCTVKLEVMPEINIPDYAKLKLERLVTEPSTDDIKQAEADLADSFGKTEEVKEKRAIKKGDFLSVDLKVFLEGEEVSEAGVDGYLIEVGKNQLPPPLDEDVIGKKAGDEIKKEVTFPKEAEAKFAGKKGRYELSIKELRQKAKVTLDDAFAKEIGYETKKELDEDIKKRLTAKYVEESFIYTKRMVLDGLAKLAKFDVPQSMVEAEFNTIWTQMQKDLAQSGKDKLDQKEEDEMKKDYQAIAERRVRLGLLLGEIGRDTQIEVPEKMIHQELANRARAYPGQEREVVDFYMKNPDAMAALRAPLFENLVIQHVVDKAEVTDKKVTPDQLVKKVDEVVKDTL